jgi:hypothetical protein
MIDISDIFKFASPKKVMGLYNTLHSLLLL